ncbi:hypothetical protein [Cellulomonas sp. RIT-PI-Y]|jgi:hypothetical protein|uniref:hypothetical protein n=1 Tax=Cellulomonas sp. RIT-PI-Y TaxID=3035297 RepID=UPI0021DADE5B|nr:hypothetical protein [Cellulomonas sp. RIT-PI-Y]
MSTVPGHESWRDAGLESPATTDLPELDPADRDDPDDPADGGYHPADPRPDLDGRADPADVAEQRAELPEDEGEDYPG